MRVRFLLTSLLLISATGIVTSQSLAQAPPPQPASPTLWSFLGIPQAYYKLNGAFVNRRGNAPALEARPPLKGIAHPDNLESDFEPIKTAAEVKQAEDLAPQKIKGIKYLAKVGCGCYDKDGKVTKALLAGMEDCTEDVREATVKAISKEARGERCAKCGGRSCCSEEISMKLAELAYERDEFGCYIEPSEDVRRAAIRALNICCPGQVPVEVLDEEEGEYEVEPGGDQPTEAADPPPELPAELDLDANAALMPAERSARRAWQGTKSETGLSSFVQTGPPPHPAPTRQVAAVKGADMDAKTEPATVSRRKPQRVLPVIDLTSVRGVVDRVDVTNGFANIQLTKEMDVPAGTKLDIFHQYLLGTRHVATMEVVRSVRGNVNARSLDGRPLYKIARGDQVRAAR